MQAHPEWNRRPRFPVARVRFYSERPIATLRREEVCLRVSGDNRRYRKVAGTYEFRQGTVRRRHARWTPAGVVKEQGRRKNWFVEFDGLSLRDAYVSIDLGATPCFLEHRGFMFAEAWDASGQSLPLTVATNGDSRTGHFFWKGWRGWANHTEALLDTRSWDGRALGVVFREMPNMPTLLEPAFEGARRIWLGRVARILDAGADGVDIRTYCHHNGPMQFLKFAFAEPVRAAFKDRYGRDPRPEERDYARIRAIRGEFYTQFMREAKELARTRGKKFIIELESGIEVPPSLNCRMQLPMEWRKWIREGIPDEIRLKWWTAESPFIHAEVMPLARRHGIPVHIISRCLHTGVDVRAREMAQLTFGRACAAGFAGYCLYEQQNLMDMNPEGYSWLKGPVRAFLEEAGRSLARVGA